MTKQSAISLAFALFLLCACSVDTIEESGVDTSQSRELPTFTKIESEGVFELHIIQSSDQLVEITADNNIIHLVKTEVSNNTLKLYLDEDKNYRDITVKATIQAANITSIKNSGTGDITVMDVDLAGNFNIDNSGTGDITMYGISEGLSLTNEGTGEFHGFDFFIDHGNIKIEGSGDCEVNCSNQLDVNIEGSGNIYYIGNPVISAQITGSGEVTNVN
ncbi:GIN domain-containing protein [Mangrovimonas sp. TPBH4]|uniref:GIN domain-containing protein n=1 Tax=Mangrovimonas sp. TPBH4 TaxID=1645914 RepID=UPI0006B66E03|nr:DUF2807 domain-containing protein [Mangrovimonas sp. TPBH4]